ncbi:hypothetical protein ZEAMMB73_Zm00001d016238 [Zea mays]|uniref:Uncharacterized protein n=1 Tax=Zea mays TaxID=4577 RepID=A0A1D6H6D7_MAIZE|nr:hypothetical protein ZEAMMB73_Zm00001d016238 [Zea mays]AQK70364.1 hypothetical protein ZEAMMB73_Zm00001d016238 [Zea mays]
MLRRRRHRSRSRSSSWSMVTTLVCGTICSLRGGCRRSLE